MNKMKKVVPIILAAALIGGTFAACSGNSKSENTETATFDSTKEITVVSREDGSGTRGAFVELFGVEQKDADGNKVDRTIEGANVTNSTEVMISTVSGNDYAIGYCSLGSLNDSVKALQVAGVDATAANVKSGTYTVSRPFNIVTGDNLSDIAKDFMTYVLSSEGQKIIEDNGYVTAVENATSYSGSASGKLTIAGSSSVYPVMEKIVEGYKAINTGAEIEVQESDSTTGVQNAIDGICDIGMASRDLKDTETGVTATKIAIDGIAVIVNKNCPITDISKEDVCSIYTGEKTLWSDIISK